FTWDPNYDPAKHNGATRQTLLTLDSLTINFPALGVEGDIVKHNGKPGLTVYMDGFALGEAVLIFNREINLGELLKFDDVRIGVTDFSVTFGATVDFSGEIFIASGGAQFLPGKPISASITDRPGDADTEALRAGLAFEHGHVKGFIFRADTLRIAL